MARNISLNWTAPIFPVVIDPPTIIANPNDSYAVTQSYDVYGCFVGVLVLVLIIVMIKIALNRKRFQARNAVLRQTIARQNQLSTVSHSVDANSNYSNDRGNNSRDSDATLKIDLPPTYEQVMKTFIDTRARATTSPISTVDGGAVETRNTHGIVEEEIVTIPISEQRSAV